MMRWRSACPDLALKILMVFGTFGDPLHAQVLKIQQTLPKGGVETDAKFTPIRVTGKSETRYDSVITKELEFWITVSGERPGKMAGKGPVRLRLEAENGSTVIDKPEYLTDAKVYKVTSAYIDPRSATVSNTRVSPITRCNDELAKLNGPAREQFLSKGGSLLQQNAYQLEGLATHELWPGSIGFKEPYQRDFPAKAMANVSIVCAPLKGPKPRTESRTTGAPPRTGQRREPTVPVPVPARAVPDRPKRAAAQAADFDVQIRRVDRLGPDGGTRLWLYNSGPDVARTCIVTARGDGDAGWNTVATADVDSRQTLQLDDRMPKDANLRFRVSCTGEPAANFANNTAILP